MLDQKFFKDRDTHFFYSPALWKLGLGWAAVLRKDLLKNRRIYRESWSKSDKYGHFDAILTPNAFHFHLQVESMLHFGVEY